MLWWSICHQDTKARAIRGWPSLCADHAEERKESLSRRRSSIRRRNWRNIDARFWNDCSSISEVNGISAFHADFFDFRRPCCSGRGRVPARVVGAGGGNGSGRVGDRSCAQSFGARRGHRVARLRSAMRAYRSRRAGPADEHREPHLAERDKLFVFAQGDPVAETPRAGRRRVLDGRAAASSRLADEGLRHL